MHTRIGWLLRLNTEVESQTNLFLMSITQGSELDQAAQRPEEQGSEFSAAQALEGLIGTIEEMQRNIDAALNFEEDVLPAEGRNWMQLSGDFIEACEGTGIRVTEWTRLYKYPNDSMPKLEGVRAFLKTLKPEEARSLYMTLLTIVAEFKTRLEMYVEEKIINPVEAIKALEQGAIPESLERIIMYYDHEVPASFLIEASLEVLRNPQISSRMAKLSEAHDNLAALLRSSSASKREWADFLSGKEPSASIEVYLVGPAKGWLESTQGLLNRAALIEETLDEVKS